MESTVKLLNHASVKLTIDGTSIISDPWYDGSVFHKGWKLIHEIPIDEIKKDLENTDYIFVSHEHPDHFSPSFFLNKIYKEILKKNNTKVLFQETKDRRVLKFLQKNGFDVIEVPNNKYIEIKNNVEIKVSKFG